jgi:hypothetical protein
VQVVVEGVWHRTEVTLGADEWMLRAFDQHVAESPAPSAVRELNFEVQDSSEWSHVPVDTHIDTIQGYYTPRHCFYT